MTDLQNGAGSFVASYTYDSMGNVKTYTDANQKISTFDYYSNGYLLDNIDALQEKTTFTYDAMGKVQTVTDACENGACPDMTGVNHTTIYRYDTLENLSTITDANNVITKFLYDNNGNKTDEIDGFGTPLQRTTHYDYDALNRPFRITYPDATTKVTYYDFRGNKLTEIDQLGRKTQYVYDLAGELKTVTYAAGTADAGTVSYTYDADGRQKTVTDENNQGTNNQTVNGYDPAGRLTSVQNAAGFVTGYGYDADNRKTSILDANQNTTGYGYDPRGRLALITYPATTTQPITYTKYTYDGMGRLQTTTDQAGNITTKGYDNVGRLSSVTDAIIIPHGNTTLYSYDLNGNLQTIQDANQHVTSFQYDNLNHKSHRILPLQQIEDYTYDVLGRLQTKTDFNRKLTTYNYDSLDRLRQKIPDPSLNQPTISFSYTATGKRLTMTDASGTTNYPTYDNRDRLKTKSTPEGTLSYTYDAHGNVRTITSSNTNGASVTYTPDVLNRLSTVKDNRLLAQGITSATTTYAYDPVGNMKGYSYSTNGAASTYQYDTLNRLSQVGWAQGNNNLSSFAYTPYPAGNVNTVTELSGRNVTYGYDNDYHLMSENIGADPLGNNGGETYQYDFVGNRLSLNSTIPSLPGGMSYLYDANDRLSTDTYDDDGNTTGSGGVTNTYDFENLMLSHGTVTMVYDGDGNRVSETAGGVTTKYLVDTMNPTGYSQVLDELVSGSVTNTYTYGLERISENQVSGSTWSPTFYGYDGHGNVRFLTNTAGTVGNTYQFDAFGMPVASTGTTLNTYLFSGERLDNNLGLYHLRARYYNQATGRFLTMDPGADKTCCSHSRSDNIFDPGSLHKYVYTQNSPVNRIDPTGKDSIIDYAIEIGESEESIAQLQITAKHVQFDLCVEGVLLDLSEQFQNFAGSPGSGLYLIQEAFEECGHLL